MSFQWIEDDFPVPHGVCRLDRLPEPESGKKYVMYHGTTRQAAQLIMQQGFRQSEDGMLGPGVYLSRDLEKARRYPINHPEWDKAVIKVVVDVGRVIAINYQGHPRQKTWHDPGYGEVYDTAWVPPKCGMVPSGLEEDCVWDPNRIKIISVFHPQIVPQAGGFGLYFAPGSSVLWPEDNEVLPEGVGRLDLPKPESGKKYVMYHGTSRWAARNIMQQGFRQSIDGMFGPGIYLSRDLEKASCYPINHPEWDKVVIRVEVDVGKVIIIEHQGHPLQKTWHDYGYDTAWLPPKNKMVNSGREETCVWDPNRIRIIGIIHPYPIWPWGRHGAWGSQ